MKIIKNAMLLLLILNFVWRLFELPIDVAIEVIIVLIGIGVVAYVIQRKTLKENSNKDVY